MLCCVCGVLDHLAPVNQCSVSVRCVACVVSWATWLLFTGAYAQCVVLRVQCPWPLGSCSPCARSACSVPCAVSWATWLLLTGVYARRVVLRVWTPGQLGSCSPVCTLGVFCCVCGVLGHLAPVRRCVRSACCVAFAVSWATWLLFTGVLARSVALRVRCPGPLGSCLPVCKLGALCCVRGVLGHLAPVNRCARSLCCAVCCVSGVLGHLAPDHPCAHQVCLICSVAPSYPGGASRKALGVWSFAVGCARVHPDSGFS